MRKLLLTILGILVWGVLIPSDIQASEAYVIGIVATISSREEELVGDTVLNEIYPNTLENEDEWVEIYNRGSWDEDVSGWITRDLYEYASHKIIIPEGTILAPGEKYKGYFSIDVLNNGGDTVYLFDKNGVLVDEFTYDSSIPGNSWKRDPDGAGNWVEVNH